MARIVVPIHGVDCDLLAQLSYALTFASEGILSYEVRKEEMVIEVETKEDFSQDEIRLKIAELVERYQHREFGLPKIVHFKQDRELPAIDAWAGLLERKWVTPVGIGHVVLRGPAAQLMSLIDAKVHKMFVQHFHAELEVYPSTIQCKTLDRCNHFTSFPEHIDFVSHIKQDLAVLNKFSAECRERGWSSGHHDGIMADCDFAICPSCCYHCYEAMEGWQLEPSGSRTVTAILGCHRHEGANHRALSRLRAFTMREIVWVGHPRFVIEARAKAEELIIQWAKDWELVGTFETANDMFFTQDYAVKASFQRQQQAKKELKLLIPSEQQAISVFSSNFHAMTFGKAFNISIGGRPASSGCLGWGYERWVYAIFSQMGFDTRQWPAKLREEFELQQGSWR